LDLVSSESPEVGDIENTIVGLSVLTMDTSDLHVVLVSDRLVEIFVLHQLWEVDMNGSSETSSHIGWAGGDVTKMLIIGELCLLLDLVGSIGESLEDSLDVGSLLHRNNSKLILLIDPDKESLVVIVEDTSSFWPISLKSSRLEIFITTLEEEMISDELFLFGFSHGLEGVVFTFELSFECGKSGGNQLLDLLSLLSCNGGSEWVGSKISCNSDSCGVDHLILILWEWWAVKLIIVHGRDVLVSGFVSMIRLDDLVHEWGEGIVGVMGACINTNSRVSPF